MAAASDTFHLDPRDYERLVRERARLVDSPKGHMRAHVQVKRMNRRGTEIRIWRPPRAPQGQE